VTSEAAAKSRWRVCAAPCQDAGEQRFYFVNQTLFTDCDVGMMSVNVVLEEAGMRLNVPLPLELMSLAIIPNTSHLFHWCRL
jgi:hypothetical protein